MTKYKGKFNPNAICPICDSRDIGQRFITKGSPIPPRNNSAVPSEYQIPNIKISYKTKKIEINPILEGYPTKEMDHLFRLFVSQIDYFERICKSCGCNWPEYTKHVTDSEIEEMERMNETRKTKKKGQLALGILISVVVGLFIWVLTCYIY